MGQPPKPGLVPLGRFGETFHSTFALAVEIFADPLVGFGDGDLGIAGADFQMGQAELEPFPDGAFFDAEAGAKVRGFEDEAGGDGSGRSGADGWKRGDFAISFHTLMSIRILPQRGEGAKENLRAGYAQKRQETKKRVY